jgi:hypothetical protein
MPSWPGHGDDWASTASGNLRLGPTLEQQPVGRGLSPSERAYSYCGRTIQRVGGTYGNVWLLHALLCWQPDRKNGYAPPPSYPQVFAAKEVTPKQTVGVSTR